MVVLEAVQKEIGSSVAVIENKTHKARCGLRRSIYIFFWGGWFIRGSRVLVAGNSFVRACHPRVSVNLHIMCTPESQA